MITARVLTWFSCFQRQKMEMSASQPLFFCISLLLFISVLSVLSWRIFRHFPSFICAQECILIIWNCYIWRIRYIVGVQVVNRLEHHPYCYIFILHREKEREFVGVCLMPTDWQQCILNYFISFSVLKTISRHLTDSSARMTCHVRFLEAA